MGFKKKWKCSGKWFFSSSRFSTSLPRWCLAQSLILSTCMSISTPTDQLAGRWLWISTRLKLKERQNLQSQQQEEEVSQTTSDGKKTMSGRLQDWSSFIIYLDPVEYSS